MLSVPLHAIRCVGVCGALLLGPAVVSAQTGSLFGSRGPTAQPSLGGLRSGTTIGGGGIGTGMGGFGTMSASPLTTSGFGATGLGATGLGAAGPTGTFGTPGGFVGRNFSAQGFVGAQQAGQGGRTTGRMGGVGGQYGQLGGQFGGAGLGFGGGQNQFGMNNFRRNNQDRNQDFGFQNQGRSGQTGQAQIVVRSEVAFPVPDRAVPAVATRLNAQFQRIASRQPDFANVAFAAGPRGEVTLRGTVPTEDSRDLAAALVRLEPGVRTVRNELVVAPGP